LPFNRKSSLAPPIFYVAKNRQLKDRRLPIANYGNSRSLRSDVQFIRKVKPDLTQSWIPILSLGIISILLQIIFFFLQFTSFPELLDFISGKLCNKKMYQVKILFTYLRSIKEWNIIAEEKDKKSLIVLNYKKCTLCFPLFCRSLSLSFICDRTTIAFFSSQTNNYTRRSKHLQSMILFRYRHWQYCLNLLVHTFENSVNNNNSNRTYNNISSNNSTDSINNGNGKNVDNNNCNSANINSTDKNSSNCSATSSTTTTTWWNSCKCQTNKLSWRSSCMQKSVSSQQFLLNNTSNWLNNDQFFSLQS